MGFYYLLLLLIGIVLLVVGARWKGVSWPVKMTILSFVIGTFCVVTAVIMLMPGSAELVSILLQLE